MSEVPTISVYTRWNCLVTPDASKSRSTPILTVHCSFQRVFCLGSVRRGVSYKCTKCSGWVHAKCSGILNAAQYRRKSDWTCDTFSAPPSQQLPPPTLSPAPPTEQISDDSTFNVLQLNANGSGNKLTEIGVVLERNKVLLLYTHSHDPC